MSFCDGRMACRQCNHCLFCMGEELFALLSDLADLCSCGILLDCYVLLQGKVCIRVNHWGIFLVKARTRTASELKEHFIYAMRDEEESCHFFIGVQNEDAVRRTRKRLVVLYSFIPQTRECGRFCMNELF
mmetsp:Transcript_28734/g.42224  ORF Transcript_28734/g.42224 Transcript_28734/m.42224 type:complete len:130 (-) Transcript_28734:433-822(-)